jgi:protein-S-isoprenylcysteine O-methyltransferase Ste14
MATIRRSIVVSLLFTLFGGPAIVLVLVPFAITKFRVPAGEPLAQILVAAALILAGLAPLFDSMARFVVIGRGTLVPTVPTEHLVVSGLYRFVRNPMYVGVLTVIAGEALLFWNRGMIVHFAVVFLAIHLFVLFYEEPRLTRTYPVEYKRYQRNVPRWLPRLTPWRNE